MGEKKYSGRNWNYQNQQATKLLRMVDGTKKVCNNMRTMACNMYKFNSSYNCCLTGVICIAHHFLNSLTLSVKLVRRFTSINTIQCACTGDMNASIL